MRDQRHPLLPTRRLLIGAALAAPFVRSVRAEPASRIVAALSPWPGMDGMPPALAFDASPGGSVLTARQGQELDINIANDSPVPIALHWRGLRAAVGTTGLAETVVAPGETLAMGFAPPEPGLMVLEGRTLSAEAPPSRLAKLLSVEPGTNAPGQVMQSDLVLALARTPVPPLSGGGEWLVNGRVAQTVFLAGGERRRLRIANIGDRVVAIRFRSLAASLIALDGQPTDSPFPVDASQLPLAPGSRADVVIDSPLGAGDLLLDDGSAVQALLHVAIDPSAAGPPAPPPTVTANPILPADIDLAAATRGTARFGAMQKGSILTSKAGRPVVVTLDNPTPAPVIYHLRGQSFRVLHALDDGWQPYWLDTLIVAPATQTLVAFVPIAPGEWRIEASPFDDISARQVTSYRIE